MRRRAGGWGRRAHGGATSGCARPTLPQPPPPDVSKQYFGLLKLKQNNKPRHHHCQDPLGDDLHRSDSGGVESRGDAPSRPGEWAWALAGVEGAPGSDPVSFIGVPGREEIWYKREGPINLV